MRQNCAFAAGFSLAFGAGALGADPGSTTELIESLRTEVAELQATVESLKAANDPDRWLTEQRADEIRGLVADVLADADTRASLLQGGSTAGWDKNFYLSSADGNWLLKIRGQLDFRWVWSQQRDAPDGEDAEYGFEVRRAKIKFGGHVVDPTWQYALNLAADHDDSSEAGDLDLQDAFIRKDFENGNILQIGQFKTEFLVEENTSSTRQLAAERSLVNEFFNQDRSHAVMWMYTGDRFRFSASYGDGFDSKNTFALFVPSAEAMGVPPYQMASNAVTGRVDWLAAGDWTQFEQFTSPRGAACGAKVGGAIHWERDKYNSFGSALAPSEFKSEFLTWTVDGMLQGDGWNAFAYVVGRNFSSDDPAVMSQDQLGFVVQGGYRLTDEWEVFGRYEWADGDVMSPAVPGPTAVGDDLSIITMGFNYYIKSQTLKWTTDVGVGLNPVASEFANPKGTGWRADAPGRDGQVVVRSQFQLLF